MSPESKVTDANQTQVPAEVRARYGVSPGDIVVWDVTPDGELRVRFRRKYQLKDLVGLIKGGTGGDAVVDKKRAQRGELKRAYRKEP